MRLLPMILLVACGYNVGSECVAVESFELDDAEVSSLGFSADALLAVAVGERTVAGHLGDDDLAPVDVTVRVTRGEGPAVLTRHEVIEERSPNGQLFGGTEFGISLICDDSFEVPTTLAVTTSDGSIDFSEAGVAWASAGEIVERARVRVRVPVAEAEGLPPKDNPAFDEVFADADFVARGNESAGLISWVGFTDTTSFELFAVTWDSTPDRE